MKDFTISSLVRENSESVFVLNTSALRPPHKRPSNVTFDVAVSGGNLRSVIVQMTWIPQDLALQMPKKVILEAPGFRDCINRGLFKLVSTEEALKLLEDPDAQEENERLRFKMNNVAQIADEMTPQRMPNEITAQAEGEKASPLMVDICQRDEDSIMTPQEVYARLRNISDTLSIDDVKYLSKNLPEKSRNTKVETFIDEKLQKFRQPA